MICCCAAIGNVSTVYPGSLACGLRESVTAPPPIVSTPSGPMKRNAWFSPPPSAKFTRKASVNAGCAGVFG